MNKKNTKNEEVKNIETVEETKADKMLNYLKAMKRNEKLIARLEKKIENLKSLNEEISKKFKTVLDA